MLIKWLNKMKGDRAPRAAAPAPKALLLAWLGGFFAIAAIAGLAHWAHAPLILGSFGASCVLLFGFPDSPFSQPRHVVFGHVISTLTGLVCLTLFGPHWWALAIAVATAIALMMWTRTVHPPAGSNPVIVFLMLPGWGFLLAPTLIGACMLVVVALIYNNLIREANYPKYW